MVVENPHQDTRSENTATRMMALLEVTTSLLEMDDDLQLGELLSHEQPADLAELLQRIDDSMRTRLFSLLEKPLAANTLVEMDSSSLREIVGGLEPGVTAGLVREMAPDDAADVLAQLSEEELAQILDLLDAEDRQVMRGLLAHDQETGGALMTPDFAMVAVSATVGDALQVLREVEEETGDLYYVYVVDEQKRPTGMVSIHKLVRARPSTPIVDVMDPDVVFVTSDTDQEEISQMFERYHLLAVPVVDEQGRMVGRVTADDVMEVAEAEATEDFHRVASIGTVMASLREAPLSMLFKARIGWLMALVVMNVFSGAGIAMFEETISSVVALVFFLPLLIDSGGNAGSQSATLMIRAMATGDVRMNDWFRLLGKELGVALAIGMTMAAGVSAISYFRAPEVLVVVALSMAIIVLVGSLLGMSLPFLFTRLGWDPATASAPLITSMSDISGVLIYFSIASWYLGSGG